MHNARTRVLTGFGVVNPVVVMVSHIVANQLAFVHGAITGAADFAVFITSHLTAAATNLITYRCSNQTTGCCGMATATHFVTDGRSIRFPSAGAFAYHCTFQRIAAPAFAVGNCLCVAGIHGDFDCNGTVNRLAGYHTRILRMFNHIVVMMTVLMMFIVMLVISQGAVSKQHAAGQSADE